MVFTKKSFLELVRLKTSPFYKLEAQESLGSFCQQFKSFFWEIKKKRKKREKEREKKKKNIWILPLGDAKSVAWVGDHTTKQN